MNAYYQGVPVGTRFVDAQSCEEDEFRSLAGIMDPHTVYFDDRTDDPVIGSPTKRVQCRGYNKSNGERCTRKIAELFVQQTSSTQDFLCHQHRGTDVEETCKRYSDWIDPTLSDFTKQRLCSELSKPISEKDGPGFIYVYQLVGRECDISITRNGGNTMTQSFMYKIGRTTNVDRRLNQWKSRCGYVPRLVECFPALDALARPCRYSHRCERLIHVELSERFGTGPVVCPGRCKEAHYEWFRIKPEKSFSEQIDMIGTFSTGPRHVGWQKMRAIILKWISFIENQCQMPTLDKVVDLPLPDGDHGPQSMSSTRTQLYDEDDETSDDEFYSFSEDGDDEDNQSLKTLSDALSCMCLRDTLYNAAEQLGLTASALKPFTSISALTGESGEDEWLNVSEGILQSLEDSPMLENEHNRASARENPNHRQQVSNHRSHQEIADDDEWELLRPMKRTSKYQKGGRC